jgi:hypothetical protein
MSSQPVWRRVLLRGFITACQVKTRSRASYGAPSDQRIPRRKCSTIVLPSALMPPLRSVGTSVTAAGMNSPFAS